MSIAEYIKQYYGPYMCSTDRHSWIIDRRETEKKDGIMHCEWCGKKRIIRFYTLLHRVKRLKFIPPVDIMPQTNISLDDVPWEKVMA